MKKDKLEHFAQKVDQVKAKVDESVRDKVMPVVKGYEGVIIIVAAVVIIASFTIKALILGLIVAAVLMLPSYLPKIMAKLEKKEEPKVEATKIEEVTVIIEKEEEKKEE